MGVLGRVLHLLVVLGRVLPEKRQKEGEYVGVLVGVLFFATKQAPHHQGNTQIIPVPGTCDGSIVFVPHRNPLCETLYAHAHHFLINGQVRVRRQEPPDAFAELQRLAFASCIVIHHRPVNGIPLASMFHLFAHLDDVCMHRPSRH